MFFLSFDTAKLRRFSAGCFFFYVFLPSLCGHINEFWPKLRSSVRVLARTAKKRENMPIFNTSSLCIDRIRTYPSLLSEPSTSTILWMYIFFMFSRAGFRYWRGSK